MSIPPREDERPVEPTGRVDAPEASSERGLAHDEPSESPTAPNGPVATEADGAAPLLDPVGAAPTDPALPDAPPDDEPVRTASAFAEIAQAESPPTDLTAAPPEATEPTLATPASELDTTTADYTAALPQDQAPPPPPPDVPAADDYPSPSPDDEGEGMTMLEHLEELRVRVIIACVALALGLAVSAIPTPWTASLTQTVIVAVNKPAEGHLQAIKPGEIFITYFKVALIVGAALAMPALLYQVMKFVLPALHPHEKKYLFMSLPGMTLAFVIGVGFGYMLLLPFAINFLLTFGAAEFGVEVKWSFGEYVGTVTSLLFWMGLAFETPLMMFFLTKLRVLNVERLVRFRKYALILAFIAGAIITPTPDPLNQTIISLPLYLLFELGILLAKLA